MRRRAATCSQVPSATSAVPAAAIGVALPPVTGKELGRAGGPSGRSNSVGGAVVLVGHGAVVGTVVEDSVGSTVLVLPGAVVGGAVVGGAVVGGADVVGAAVVVVVVGICRSTTSRWVGVSGVCAVLAHTGVGACS